MRRSAFLYLVIPVLLFTCAATAQQYVSRYKKKEVKPDPYRGDTLLQPIPITRASWHDKIDNEQSRADGKDNKQDKVIRMHKDSLASALLTRAIIKKVDTLQRMIENMPPMGRDNQAEHMHKIRSLRALWELMRQYSADARPKAGYYDSLVANMQGMLKAANEDSLMKYVEANTNIYSLNNGLVLMDDQPAVRAYIYTQMGRAYPMMMIKRLPEYAKDTFAGNIIKEAVKIDQRLIFNYAYSTNTALKNAVYNTRDPLVQAIVKITSHSASPPKAFPFLSDIYRDRKTVEQVDSLAASPDNYFNNLVRLKMLDDSIARKAYIDELQYRALKYYVRQMNELHEEKDEVRFKCIDSLPATSLFYILVYGQDEIYTSSFLGTFKRLLERMKPMKGDELLDTLNQDHFRTFIRMCAGYNTLSTFLGTMDDTMRTDVMDEFISGLQEGNDDDLEGAVEVADAFGSIRDSALSAYLRNQVRENYELSYKERSKKGMIVYSLLAMLFQGNRISGSDNGAAITSERLKLPPINKVSYNALMNDSGIVYQQVFFYGDKDGEGSYASFMSSFKKDKNWKVTELPYWTEIASVTGKKTVIYANLPLKEPEDEKALDTLTKFLSDSGISPTVMIHRGHSYHLKLTIEKLTPDARIVILGSCGGYHNLASVLEKSPDAHIVSSKQTGVMAVNEPLLRAMNARLIEGADINWIGIWGDLETQFRNKPDVMEKFSDYVPPYKNLGAIFIKAYKKMMEPALTPPETSGP